MEPLEHVSMKSMNLHGGLLATYHTNTLPLDVSRVNSTVIPNVYVYFINVQSVIAILLDTIKNIAQYSTLGSAPILQSVNVYRIMRKDISSTVVYTMTSYSAHLLQLQLIPPQWIG